jgi:hypothetical protein
MYKKVMEFLKKNGWEISDNYPAENDLTSFYKPDNISIDVNEEEIVLIDDNGDFLHFEIDNHILYTLLGYLMQHHYLAIDYKWVEL